MILKKLNIQTFNSNSPILINIVGTLNLMIRNLDFVLYDWSRFQDLDFTVELLQKQY